MRTILINFCAEDCIEVAFNSLIGTPPPDAPTTASGSCCCMNALAACIKIGASPFAALSAEHEETSG